MITEMISGMSCDIAVLLWQGLVQVDWGLARGLCLALLLLAFAMSASYYQGMDEGYQYAKETLLVRTQSFRSSSDIPNLQTLDPGSYPQDKGTIEVELRESEEDPYGQA